MSAVRVPTPLRPYTEGLKEIEVQASTVGEALQRLAEQYPGLKAHLFDDQGSLRAYVNVFVNDEDMRGLQGEATPVASADRVTIIPSIAGGIP
jgi:molybdopterin converting factor small subunit